MLETAANDHNPGVTSDQAPKKDVPLHEIVIVGGGAAGLELATGLGNSFARRKRTRVTLVDKARAHLWKPLLHSVAADSLDFDEHALDYLAQAHWHDFGYRFGEVIGLDRARKQIQKRSCSQFQIFPPKNHYPIVSAERLMSSNPSKCIDVGVAVAADCDSVEPRSVLRGVELLVLQPDLELLAFRFKPENLWSPRIPDVRRAVRGNCHVVHRLCDPGRAALIFPSPVARSNLSDDCRGRSLVREFPWPTRRSSRPIED